MTLIKTLAGGGRWKIALVMLACLAMVASLAGTAAAQDLRGRVQGIVADGSGAVIVGAKVTLRNEGTNVETAAETNPAGQYLFDFVVPGNYTITVEMEGFRTFVQRNVAVQTRGDISVNATLEVGAVTETVTVEEAPVAVKFTTTTMETTLDTKMSEELPVIHRHPLLLLMVDPQVVYTSGSTERSAYHHWAGSRMDVGGGTELTNEILVDGSTNTWGPKTNYVPPMDAVSELNVQQNATDAEFGHSSGGVMSLQMKSGTNDFHGTAYFFGRNPKLNARADSFNNSPSVIRRNVWGVSSGNPIVRNKLFNYFAYEGQNERAPTNLNVTVPTSLQRNGDFSQTFALSGAVKPIYDPLTTQFDQASNTSTRTQFANNVIPTNRVDATSRRLLQDVWEPNRPGDNITGIFNFRTTFARPFEYYNYSNRTDWEVNDNVKVFGRFSRLHTVQTSPDVTGSPAQATGGSERNSMTAAGDMVWTINPNTVFNVRSSYGKPVDRFTDPQSELDNYGDFWPGNNWYDSYASELPQNYYPGYLVRVPGSDSSFGRRNYWYSAPDFWNLSSKISMQMGKHYVKVGGEYRKYRGNTGFFQPFELRFNPANTADTFINPNTALRGDAWATMLLGVLDNDSWIRTDPLYEGGVGFWGFFIQDDYKLSPNVTLNLGLRWEYDTSLHDRQGRLSHGLDLTDPIPQFQGANAPVYPAQVLAIRGSTPNHVGAWNFTDGPDDGSYRPPKDVILPRAGIAIRLNDRTALRIGYSRYATPTSVNIDGGLNLNDTIPYTGFQQVSNPLPVIAGVPQSYVSDPFPSGVNPLTPIPGKSLGRNTELGSTGVVDIFADNIRAATNDRFNFSLQRETKARIVLDFTYFYSHGTNHHYKQRPNLLDPRYGYEHRSAVDARVPNPYYNIASREEFPGGLRNQQTVPVSTLLRPYPYYGDLSVWLTGARNRRYQSFQFKAQRQFSNGFNFLVGYNYNRRKNDEFYDAVDEVDGRFTMINDDNPRHKLSLSGIYEFPFGRGRKWGNNANKVVDAILGGWSTSGIYEYIGGDFLRFGAMLVNGDPAIDNPTREQRFDTSVFVRQPAFTRRSNPWQFDGVHGPRYSNLDLTLAKQHPITEKIKLEIRMEAYNFTNSFMGGAVNTNVDSSLFGSVTGQRAAFFGRQLQYMLRLRW